MNDHISASPRLASIPVTALMVALMAVLMTVLMAGCAVSPHTITAERLTYNEAVKVTTEQQLLLNIVRLRYTDTPSSISVSAIALQKESGFGAQILPFFEVGDAATRGLSAILPAAQMGTADRPTLSLTPQDDQDFTRRLFTPISLEGVLYLAKTSWPISTVFRLWLGNLNWVSNAQAGTGPAGEAVPMYRRFLEGIQALQELQDLGQAVLAVEEREEPAGPPIPAARIQPGDLLAAVKEGYGYRAGGADQDWVLVRRRGVPVLRLHPGASTSPEAARFRTAFRLDPARTSYDIGLELLSPFPEMYLASGVQVLDVDTRSLLQVLYFISKGVTVPAEHRARGIVHEPPDETGRPFDWKPVLQGLFRVDSSSGASPPPDAHVAVRYRDHWFHVDARDHQSMSTFSLLMEVARMELADKPGAGPTLTLPIGGR